MVSLFKRWFRKRRASKGGADSLHAGLLRSTTPSPRAHDHFAVGDLDISNNELVSEAERSRLRSWCKKEYLDNPYARNAGRSFSLGVYGSGPQLQLCSPDEELNNRIETLFNRWRRRADLDWKIHIALEALFYDGEAFFLFFASPYVPGGMDVELVEARRICDPFDSYRPNRVDGIVYNAFNRPVSYCVQTEAFNPNAPSFSYEEIPAERIVHFYLDDLVNQRRGLPLLQSVLGTLASLNRIGEASLSAWELAAKMNLFVQTPLDAHTFLQCVPKGYDPEAENRLEAFSTMSLPRDGGVTFLPNGMTMGQVKAEHPTSQYHQNKTTYLAEIGAGVGEPRNIVTADSSDYNFSSARMDLQMFYRWSGACQRRLSRLLDRCLAVAVAALADEGDADALKLLSLYEPEDIPAEWHFPQVLDRIDRIEDADAETRLLAAGLLTRREYCKRHGLNYEKYMEDWQYEQDALNLQRSDASESRAASQTQEDDTV